MAIRAVLGYSVAGLVLGPLVRLLLPGREGIGVWRTAAVVLAGCLAGVLVAGAVGTGEVGMLPLAGVAVGVTTALALVAAGLRLAGAPAPRRGVGRREPRRGAAR